MKSRSAALRLLPLLIFVLILSGLDTLGYIQGFNNWLSEKRMAVAPRKATGSIAFIAIDKKSLDAFGVWPWPRSIYANLVDKLAASDVKDIAFDVDFSSASRPDEDQRLAASLAAAGGSVILPAFVQAATAKSDRKTLSANVPIAAFRDTSWLATVNIETDYDGIVRSFPYGGLVEGHYILSLPCTLAGVSTDRTDSFTIDFSIATGGVSVYSVSDVLADGFDMRQLAGKSVILGADALELKDFFLTPVHGVISGPMIQILAAETQIQHRALQPMRTELLLLAIALVLLVLQVVFRPVRLFVYGLELLALAILVEGTGFYVQMTQPLIVPTGAALLLLLAVFVHRMIDELGIRKWLLRRATIESRNNRQILEQIIADSTDAIVVVDDHGMVLDMSRNAPATFGCEAEFRIGQEARLLLPAAIMGVLETVLFEAERLEGGDANRHEVSVTTSSGARVLDYLVTPSRMESPGTSDVAAYYVATITARDITEERQQQRQLDYISKHDDLTGALRQSEFELLLDARIANLPPEGVVLPVYTLNLHRFKTVNSTLGREVGNALLRAAVERLRDPALGMAHIARLGGDTFCMYPDATLAPEAVQALGQSVIDVISVPFRLGDYTAKIGGRMGISCYDGKTKLSAAALVGQSEFALDEARQVNGSGLARFDPSGSEKILKSRMIEQELWGALENGQIHLVYQPQVTLTDQKLIGAEALVRWIHPTLGFVSPMDFVEIAEANGFIEKLGHWVLERACREAMTWDPHLVVAVNVSPLQFTRGDIVSDVMDALAASGLPAERLHIEITESTFLNPSSLLIVKLQEIKALGISIALDDFGTGYSSFGYLAKFPLDKIKLDQMFVRSLTQQAESRAIVRSVLVLAQGLGITMICEGVETEAELTFLRDLGVSQGQGYLFGKPQSSQDIRNFQSGRI